MLKGDINMSTITVRMNDEEERMYKEYAILKNMPLSTLLKEALQEKIEDEFDIKLILEYEQKLEKGEVEFINLDKVKKS